MHATLAHNEEIVKILKIKKQKGYGLLEVMITLAIVAVVVAGVLVLSNTTRDASLAQKFTNDALLIVTQSRLWKGNKANYTGISINELTTAGMLDSSWNDGTGINSRGGDYTVDDNTSNTAHIDVGITKLGDTLCANVERAIEHLTVSGGAASCSGGTLTATFE